MGQRQRQSSLQCGDADVTALLRFVEARWAESTPPTGRSRYADNGQDDLRTLTAVLLDRARATCRPDLPCQLSTGDQRLLRRIAVVYEDHPDFDYVWHYGV